MEYNVVCFLLAALKPSLAMVLHYIWPFWRALLTKLETSIYIISFWDDVDQLFCWIREKVPKVYECFIQLTLSWTKVLFKRFGIFVVIWSVDIGRFTYHVSYK